MAQGNAGKGRPKGSANKATVDLFAICAAKGINVFDGLLELCKHENPGIALKAHSEAAKYLYPQRKAVEISNDPESAGFRIVVDDYKSKGEK